MLGRRGGKGQNHLSLDNSSHDWPRMQSWTEVEISTPASRHAVSIRIKSDFTTSRLRKGIGSGGSHLHFTQVSCLVSDLPGMVLIADETPHELFFRCFPSGAHNLKMDAYVSRQSKGRGLKV